jgi:hypothetical protein
MQPCSCPEAFLNLLSFLLLIHRPMQITKNATMLHPQCSSKSFTQMEEKNSTCASTTNALFVAQQSSQLKVDAEITGEIEILLQESKCLTRTTLATWRLEGPQNTQN